MDYFYNVACSSLMTEYADIWVLSGLPLSARFLRWLLKAEGLHIDVDEEDYELLANMGTGVGEGLENTGIACYDHAKEACSVITAASGAQYGVDDLICFMCLSTHKEAVAGGDFPEPAPPVSVEDDLGLKCPRLPLKRSAPRLRISKKCHLSPRTPCLGLVMPELMRWPHIAVALSLIHI